MGFYLVSLSICTVKKHPKPQSLFEATCRGSEGGWMKKVQETKLVSRTSVGRLLLHKDANKNVTKQ